jgi:hypothetical protein
MNRNGVKGVRAVKGAERMTTYPDRWLKIPAAC